MLTRATLIQTAMVTALTMSALVAMKYAIPNAGHITAGDDPIPIGTIARPPGATLHQPPAKRQAAMQIEPSRPLVVEAPAPARWTVDSVPMPQLPPMPAAAPVRSTKVDRGPLPAGRTAPDSADVTGSIPVEDQPTPMEEERSFTQADVIDGRTMKAGGLRIRLAGIALPKPDRTCLRLDGTREACADRAKTRLELFTAHRTLICTLTTAPKSDLATGRCRVGTTDLAQWLAREGWVTPTGDDATLAAATTDARRMKAGIWR